MYVCVYIYIYMYLYKQMICALPNFKEFEIPVEGI